MQLPWLDPRSTGSGLSEGIAGIGDTFVQLAQMRQQRNQQAAENLLRGRQVSAEEQRLKLAEEADKRQGRKEMGEEHAKIRDLYAKDPRLAASYLNSIGAQGVGVEAVYGGQQAEGAPPQLAPAAPQLAPPAFEGDQGEDEPPKAGIEPPPFAPPGAPPQPPSAAAGAPPEDSALPMSPAAQPTGPLVGHRLRYTLADGHETVLDPMEQRQIRDAERQERMSQLDAAGLPPKYKMIIAARVAQGDKAPWEGISAAMKADEDRTAKADENQKYNLTAKQKYEVGMAGAKARQVVTPNQRSDNERADVSAFGADTSRWEKNANVDKLTDAFDKFSEMGAQSQAYARTGDVIGQRGALYGAARYITGPGVLTENEYKNTVTNTKGWTNALASKISKGVQGDLGPEEWAAMQLFVSNAQRQVKARSVRAVQNFDHKYSPESRYSKTVPDEVAAYRDSLLTRFGLTAEDIPAAPAAAARPAAHGEPAARPNGPAAGGRPKAASADVARARAMIADPKETPERKANAQRFLADHGQ